MNKTITDNSNSLPKLVRFVEGIRSTSPLTYILKKAYCR